MSTEIAALLLDRGADLEQVVPGDESALIQASGSGKLDGARLLVSRGANVNARVWADGDGPGGTGEWRSPLLMAKRGGHQAVVEYPDLSWRYRMITDGRRRAHAAACAGNVPNAAAR